MREVKWGNELTVPKLQYNTPAATVSRPKIILGTLGSGTWLFTRWTNKEKRDAISMRVRKFTELVEGGMTPNNAAKELNTSVEAIRKTRDKLGSEVQELIDSHGWMSKDVKREWVRANQVKILDNAMEASAADPTDSKLLKIALEATRLIGEDRDIALYQNKTAPVVLSPALQPALPPALQQLLGQGVTVNPDHILEEEQEDKGEQA